MDAHDPGRWAHPDADVPDAVRQVVRSAAADEASPERVSRFVGRMKSTLAAAPSVPSARLGAAKSLAVLGAVVAGGALLAWLALGSSGRGDPRAPVRAPGPPRTASTAASSPSIVSASPAPRSSAPAVGPSSTAAPQPPQEPVGRTPNPLRPADTLDREVRLLQAARALVDSDPAGALRLAEQHRARFPNGVLAQEREVLSIRALDRQGRSAEAAARAERFRRQYPGSAHMDQLPEGSAPVHN